MPVVAMQYIGVPVQRRSVACKQGCRLGKQGKTPGIVGVIVAVFVLIGATQPVVRGGNVEHIEWDFAARQNALQQARRGVTRQAVKLADLVQRVCHVQNLRIARQQDTAVNADLVQRGWQRARDIG